MWINFKKMTALLNRNVARWMSVLIVTLVLALIVTFILSSQATNTLSQLPFTLPGLSRQAMLVTNGADRWNNDNTITAPLTNFSPFNSNALSVSPLFTRAYQTYGTTSNSLGAAITAAFPTTYGRLQFFVNGALLLPSTQQQAQGSDSSLKDLTNNGVQDTATGVIRLPLIQALLTVGSKLPIGGPGSTLTYVGLRMATAPDLMIPMSADYQNAVNTSTSVSSTPTTLTSQSVFIQGGTREGKAVGHLVPAVFWNYIRQPGISPHSWEKDFGQPLTEGLAFTMPVNGQTHHMLVQVFSQEALILDLDAAGQGVGAGGTIDSSRPTPTEGAIDVTGVQLLPTGMDYLSTVGVPEVKIKAKQVVWALGDIVILDTPSTGHAVVHVGQYFPLTLLGDTRRIAGIPWYHVQWSVPKKNNSQSGWISAIALMFDSPGNVPGAASFDVLSPDLSSYLTDLGPNVGVVAYDLTHQRSYTYNSSTQFISASSMKVPLMLAFLSLVEQQGRELTGDETLLLTTMIENSDNDSATAVYIAVGGGEGITTYMQKIGVNGLAADENAWGYSTITPQAMVDLLTLLYNGKILSGAHRTLALNLMENVESDQQIGVGDTAPDNATVALKDGWVTGDDGLWVMNSSGIVTVGNETYIISVYTQAQETLEGGQDITRKVCSMVASLLASS